MALARDIRPDIFTKPVTLARRQKLSAGATCTTLAGEDGAGTGSVPAAATDLPMLLFAGESWRPMMALKEITEARGQT